MKNTKYITYSDAAMLSWVVAMDFPENKLRAALSDGVMNSTGRHRFAVLVTSAYASLSVFTNEQGDPG